MEQNKIVAINERLYNAYFAKLKWKQTRHTRGYIAREKRSLLRRKLHWSQIIKKWCSK